jgi:ubiquinone/menaquinone biosynthesis C-methylase UbiE
MHPTCSNFTCSSKHLITEWLKEYRTKVNRADIFEVGAGRSILAQAADELSLEFNNLLISDGSEEMLRHSLKISKSGTKLMVADATMLPLRTGSIDALVASLADPYNSPNFWAEASRVLKSGGLALFTTPSWAWSKLFRGRNPAEQTDYAMFVTSEGTTRYLPSLIRSNEEQRSLIESEGLTASKITWVTVEQVSNAEQLSNKLSGYLLPDERVVEAYWILKP